MGCRDGRRPVSRIRSWPGPSLRLVAPILGLLGCAAPDVAPTLKVTVTGLPAAARRLELLPVLSRQAAAPVRYEDLSQVLGRSEVELRLRFGATTGPLGAGSLQIAAAALPGVDGDGCPLALGVGTLPLFMAGAPQALQIDLAPPAGQFQGPCATDAPLIRSAAVSGAVSPELLSSSGGQRVVIEGYRLDPRTTARIGDSDASVDWESPLRLALTAPPRPDKDGSTDLTLTSPGGATGRLANPLRSYRGVLRFDDKPLAALPTRTPLGHYCAPASGGRRIALADLDGDKKLDVLVACFGPAPADILQQEQFLAVGMGLGDGKFEAMPIVKLPPGGAVNTNLVLSDVDGDGHLDLALSAAPVRSLTLKLWEGPGSFMPPTTIGSSGVLHLASADLDQDGVADLVSVGNATQVFLGRRGNLPKESGTCNLSAMGINNNPRVVIADIDGRNGPDLLLTSSGRAAVGVCLNGGGASWPLLSQTTGLTFGPQEIVAGDLDGDGRPDVVVLRLPDSGVFGGAVLRNRGGTLPVATPLALPRAYRSMQLGDLNSDGRGDLLLCTAGFESSGADPGTCDLFLNDGVGGFSAAPGFINFPVGAVQAIGDVNGDGLPDLVGAVVEDGAVVAVVRLNQSL